MQKCKAFLMTLAQALGMSEFKKLLFKAAWPYILQVTDTSFDLEWSFPLEVYIYTLFCTVSN